MLAHCQCALFFFMFAESFCIVSFALHFKYPVMRKERGIREHVGVHQVVIVARFTMVAYVCYYSCWWCFIFIRMRPPSFSKLNLAPVLGSPRRCPQNYDLARF